LLKPSKWGKILIVKIMKKILTILLLVVFSFACGARSDETTPEMAQSLLKVRGFNFSEDEFFKAISQSDAPAVKLFLQGGIKPNVKNKKGETALTYAAEHADGSTLKNLIEKANINEPDDLGNMPLFVALKTKHEENFNFLLDNNADPNSNGTANNIKNQSVLYVAVILQKTDIIRKLLDKGADPNMSDSGGAFPVSEQILYSSPNIEVIKMLLDKMKDVNKQETNGATLLIYASKNSKMPSDTQKEIIKMLLDKGADKKLKDKNGKTALDWAKERKNTAAIEALK
jgi:ankyrin repeat protein